MGYSYQGHFCNQDDQTSMISMVFLCRAKGSHSSKRHHHGRAVNRQRRVSASPAPHRRTSGRKKSKSSLQQRSSSWSSVHSSSRSKSREHTQSKIKSPHARQINSRYRPAQFQSCCIFVLIANSLSVCHTLYTYITFPKQAKDM